MDIDIAGQPDVPLTSTQMQDLHPALLQGMFLKLPLTNCPSLCSGLNEGGVRGIVS